MNVEIVMMEKDILAHESSKLIYKMPHGQPL